MSKTIKPKPWDEDLERWWKHRVKDFVYLQTAIWHMPDAASRRMRWLEQQLKAKSKR